MYYSKFDSPLYMIMTVVNATDLNRTNLPIKKRKWSARTLFVLGMLVLVSFAVLAANEATANKTKVAKPVQKIATFIIYMPLIVKGNSVVFLPDPYQLIK